MIAYIPASAAEPLSAALWALTRPPAVRDPRDTEYMFGWIDAPDGSKWLEVDTTFTIPVHADAELGDIADILQPWIDSGNLAADTNTQLASLVASLRGQSLTVYDAFPPLFKSMAKTRDEMISAGLLLLPET